MLTTKERLLEVRRLQIEVNKADMARARGEAALFQEFSADHLARRAADPRFTLAPATELVTEIQPVTGQSAGRIRGEVEQVLLAEKHLPWLAEHLDEGRLDLYRAKPVTDAIKEDLAGHPEAIARFAELMEPGGVRSSV